MLNQTLMLQLL